MPPNPKHHTADESQPLLKGSPNHDDLSSPTNPQNPQNMAPWRKWSCVSILGAMTFAATFSSSVFNAAIPIAANEFHVSVQTMALATSLFVFGFAAGPILMGPASELIGRKIPFFSGYLAFIVFQIPVALAPNAGTVLGFRFLSGVASAGSPAIVGGYLADFLAPVERGVAVAVFAAMTLIGPEVGAIVGAVLVQSELGWRWTAWVSLVLGAVSSVVGYFVLPETYLPVLEQRYARRLRCETKRWALHSKMDETPVSFKDFAAYPISFVHDRGFSLIAGTLPLLAICIGIILGAVYASVYTCTTLRSKANKNGKLEPEDRLPPMIIGAAALVIGLFLFAWTSSPSISAWPQILSGIPIGFGVQVILLQSLAYIIDIYLAKSNSAISGTVMVRSLIGGLFPLFAIGLYERLHQKQPGDYEVTPTLHNDTYPQISPLNLNLHGLSIFITGASRGIGHAMALSFAKAGASSIAVGARSDLSSLATDIEAVAISAGRTPPRFLGVKMDVTDPKSVADAAAEVETVLGGLHVLINNAGILGKYGLIADSNPEEWMEVLNVNLQGPYLVTRAVLPLMLRTGGQRQRYVINVTSGGALLMNLTLSAYQVSKVALLKFSVLVNREYAVQGIVAFAIHPGNCVTDIMGGAEAIPEHHKHGTCIWRVLSFGSSKVAPRERLMRWIVFVDHPELSADSVVWLVSERREWLGGRYVNCTWDLPELMGMEEDVVDGDKLKVHFRY
ncbi:MAG: hypothetical protein Q9204_001016 [Flavoplaca sp. TL-2023a]